MKKTLLAIVALFIALATFGQSDIYMSAKFGTGYWVRLTNGALGNTVSDNYSHVRTIEVWAKRDTATHTDQVIYNAMGGNSSAWKTMYSMKVNYNTLMCSNDVLNGNTVMYNAYPLDTDWHHIAFTCDTITISSTLNDKLTIFVDGIAVISDTFSHSIINASITANQIIGQEVIDNGNPNGKDWRGNLCRFAIADTILYTSTFVPDCVYDTVMFWAGGTISNPYTTLAPLSTDSNVYYTSIIDIHAGAGYIYTLGTSPCAPSYTFYCPPVGTDSVIIAARQTNPSYKKGAHMSAHHNGWDTTIVTSITYGEFTDSMTVYTTGTQFYTDDYHNIISVDTLITINTTSVKDVYNVNDIKIFPNPSTGDFNVTVTNPVSLVIYDMTGHIVHSVNVSDKTMIHLSHGMYICNTTNTTNTITNKTVSAKILIQ